MRTAPLGSLFLASLLFAGCGDKDENQTEETGDGETAPTSHPLVPEEYQAIWDWDASGCDDGDAAVYHLAEGYSQWEQIDGDDELVLYISERWYWFHGDEDFEGDCVDQFDFRGVETAYPWGSNDPCGTCELEFWGNYRENTSVETGCNYGYDGIVAGDAGGTNSYDTWVFKMDTLTLSGDPNPNTGVYQAIIFDGYLYTDSSWGRGNTIPEVEGDYYGPATYDWVSLTTICI
jgi:hypothetical protein